MAEIELTPKQRQALKAQAHALKPVVMLGSAGLSASVLKEIDRALLAHELIKVKVPRDDREERDRIYTTVADHLSAARVQAIGKLLVLFRPAPDAPGQDEPAPRGRATSPKAPAKRPISEPSPRPGRSTPQRRDVERVNRVPAPRRDPGAATRAVGRTNAPRGKRGR
jgi:putative YhbY family RNA-binding protein